MLSSTVVRDVIGSQLPFGQPLKTNAKLINTWAKAWWCSRWIGLNQCRQTKLWYPLGVKTGVSRYLLKLPRQELGLTIQFLTGHGFMRRHQNIIDPYVDLTCRLCGAGDESPEHLWHECLGLSAQAGSIINQRPNKSRKNSWSPQQVGRFLREPSIAILLGQEAE